jgi:heptosyltransferase III
MNFSAFWALWQHRYGKYNYIFRECVLALVDILRFWGKKLTLSTNRSLVAIVRTEHFGDIVAAEPIARQVRQLHPNSHIVWIVRPVFQELVARHPDIDEVYAQPTVLRRKLLCESGVFDYLYNLEFWQSNVDIVSGWVHQNPVVAQNNVTIYNYLSSGRNLLTAFQLAANLPVQDAPPRLYLNEQERSVVDGLGLPKHFVVIHCSSNYPAKDWSVEKWQRLVKWFTQEKGVAVVEIGLKSQNRINDNGYIDLCGSLSILETAEVIRRARYFVGIDSGPSHLANAVGTYGILLFGKLDHFDFYQTYSGGYGDGTNATIIRQPNRTCAEMDFEWVLKNLEVLNFSTSYQSNS